MIAVLAAGVATPVREDVIVPAPDLVAVASHRGDRERAVEDARDGRRVAQRRELIGVEMKGVRRS